MAETVRPSPDMIQRDRVVVAWTLHPTNLAREPPQPANVETRGDTGQGPVAAYSVHWFKDQTFAIPFAC